MLADDLAGPFCSRAKAREYLDDALRKPLVTTAESDAARLREYEEQLRESWGMSDEAIANQQSDFWDRG
jgi:hypothetical protein